MPFGVPLVGPKRSFIVIEVSGSCGCCTKREFGVFGDPVNAASGVFRYRKTDLMVPDVIPIVLRRLYRADDVSPTYKGAFGIGTRHDYQMILSGDGQAYAYADLRLGDGHTLHYTRISPR
jgi:hypothetical protein